MTLSPPDDAWLNFFNNRFRECAHQLLAWGYQDARDQLKIGADDEEPAITGCIVEAIQNRLNNATTPREYLEHYSIKEEMPVHSDARKGKRRQRIDIVAECNAVQPRPELWFEAKRLKTSECTIGDYAGIEGMQCYIRGEYAPAYPSAAMIGYVQNSTFDHWLNELKRVLRDDQTLSIRTPLRECPILSCLDEWDSEHTRLNGTIIRLFHIFLDCS